MPRVILTGVVEKEDNQFVSICPELDVASCGETEEEALDMLEEALQVYLEAVHEVGELAREFQEMGIKVHPDSIEADEPAAGTMQGKNVRTYILQVPHLVAA